MKHASPKPAKLVFLISLFIPIVIAGAGTAVAFDQINQTSFGVAIKGYDTVAYHTEDRAVKGRSNYAYDWNDATWYFASAANRDLFIADPTRYAPEFGGY